MFLSFFVVVSSFNCKPKKKSHGKWLKKKRKVECENNELNLSQNMIKTFLKEKSFSILVFVNVSLYLMNHIQTNNIQKKSFDVHHEISEQIKYYTKCINE